MDIVILSNQPVYYKNARVFNLNEKDKKISCDILLCLSTVNPEQFIINTNTAIIYGDFGFKSYKNIRYKKIITYGLSEKNSVTISSSAEDDILLSIQRELIDFYNNKVEICEKYIKKSDLSPIDTVGIYVLNIVLGRD